MKSDIMKLFLVYSQLVLKFKYIFRQSKVLNKNLYHSHKEKKNI